MTKPACAGSHADMECKKIISGLGFTMFIQKDNLWR